MKMNRTALLKFWDSDVFWGFSLAKSESLDKSCEVCVAFGQRRLVLSVSKRTGKNVSFKTVVTRYKGKILKFRVSQELDLEEYNDREVSLELGIDTFGDSLEPILKVLSVE